MTVADKRKILARRASDAHAVENAPFLRQLDDGSVVQVNEILAALRALDGEEMSAAARTPYHRRGGMLLFGRRLARRHSRENDDPPRGRLRRPIRSGSRWRTRLPHDDIIQRSTNERERVRARAVLAVTGWALLTIGMVLGLSRSGSFQGMRPSGS